MANSIYWSVLACLAVTCSVYFAASDISCYDDDGQPVDWFIVYKLPKHVGKTGLQYMYMDSSSNGWRTGNRLINDTDRAVGGTLQQLYEKSKQQRDQVAYVLYNDQVNATLTSYGGHTKGIVLLDDVRGFWLVHSTPFFPPRTDQSYKWPHNGKKNGQSFLCVTYRYDQFKDIGTQLLYNNPHVYDHSIPPSFAKDLVNLNKAATGERLERPPWQNLYSGWVAGSFQSDLLVQTWPNSAHTLPSNCTMPYSVYNVKVITFSTYTSFESSMDHSKWCVTRPGSGVKWTCIGDINRDQAQEHRGGGTVCTDDPVVWDSFSSLVTSCEFCACTCSEK
ncbi:deoxyribonuclease-2-alpha isoform X2 [Stegostoma tigrinum]|uniref:deoxyribonuclease-2-alpha isoform X2 n=1 Tax=Stegostoma tigrinum TaxID=3053191 RepID=UPI00202AFF2C|nr:deoxyribonuclease-2-alpha isoform X2 [Stegostoma tigrinum]